MSKRVLLVNPHETTQGGYFPPPTGLLYLHSMLVHNGIEADWVDGNLVGFPAILAKMDEFKPDIVGISILTPGRHRGLEVARAAKERGHTVIMGGAHSTLMYEQLLTAYSSIVDFACTGAGEWTILGLAQELDRIFIPNLAWCDNGQVIHNTHRLSSINDYPFPSWDTVDWGAYNARHAGPRVISSRGCPWGRCIFCSVGVQWPQYEIRSPENVVSELEWLVEIGQPNLTFADDTLNGDLLAAKRLMRLIIQRGLKISFYATMRVDRVDEELLTLMHDAGCYEISYGVEVGDPETLRIYAKGASINQAERTIKLTQQAGMRACALMIYHGIHWRKVDPISRAWLNRIKATNIGSVDGLWILPGTELYRAMVSKGYMDDSFWLGPEPFRIYDGELDDWTAMDWAQFRIKRLGSSPCGQ